MVPADNAEEAAVVEGLEVYPIRTLRQAADLLNGDFEQSLVGVDLSRAYGSIVEHEEDYADVKGQELAKRAIEVAMARGHNVLTLSCV